MRFLNRPGALLSFDDPDSAPRFVCRQGSRGCEIQEIRNYMEVATKGVFEMINWTKIGVMAVVFGAVAGMGGGIGRNLQGAEENKRPEKSDAATEKRSATETLRYAASYA